MKLTMKTIYCKQGKKTKMLNYFPLNTNYKVVDTFTFQYEHPTFLPLKSSTDILHFKRTDEFNYKSIDVRGVRLEVIIK